MEPFKYTNKPLSEREFTFALPSIIIGVSILALPNDVAKVTSYSDGWISILLAGILFTLLALLAVKIASYFPNQSFYQYATTLVTRPVSMVITCLFILAGIGISAFTTRSVAYVSQQYLFNRTPLEALALTFLLVAVYAVSGSRVGVFRLNILFLPIILFIYLFIGVFNIKWLEGANFLPVFQTGFKGYMEGVSASFGAYIGFVIGLFYVFLIDKPKHLTKSVIKGMSVTIIFYLFIFLLSIGVFGNIVTSNLMHPTLELAKRVDLPGAVFERIDAFVYTIWIMAIFNTVAMTMDVTVLLLKSICPKVSKIMIVITLSPFIFLLSMFPKDINQVNMVANFIAKSSVFLSISVLFCFYLIIRIKGIGRHEKN